MAAERGHIRTKNQNPNYFGAGYSQPQPLMSSQVPRFSFKAGPGFGGSYWASGRGFPRNLQTRTRPPSFSRGRGERGRFSGRVNFLGPGRGSRGPGMGYKGLPPGYTFLGVHAEQRFPNAKEKLHNILQGAIKNQKLKYEYENVSGIFWKVRLEIPWPQVFDVFGEAFEKKDAEKRAAANACLQLEELGVLKAGGATAIIRKQEIGKEDEPKWIQISNELLLKLESVLETVQQMAGSKQSKEPTAGQAMLKNQSLKPNVLQACATYESQTSSSQGTHTCNPFVGSHSLPHSSQQTNAPFTVQTSEVQEGGQLNPSCVASNIIDVFCGLPVQELTLNQQDQLNTELYQEHQKLQKTTDTAVLKIREVTSKLPAASLRTSRNRRLP